MRCSRSVPFGEVNEKGWPYLKAKGDGTRIRNHRIDSLKLARHKPLKSKHVRLVSFCGCSLVARITSRSLQTWLPLWPLGRRCQSTSGRQSSPWPRASAEIRLVARLDRLRRFIPPLCSGPAQPAHPRRRARTSQRTPRASVPKDLALGGWSRACAGAGDGGVGGNKLLSKSLRLV